MKDDPGFYFVTKYALTKGIMRVPRGAAAPSTCGKYLVGRWDADMRYQHLFIEPHHWFESLGGAVHQAEKMRQKKLESLRKQISRMESLKPAVVDF